MTNCPHIWTQHSLVPSRLRSLCSGDSHRSPRLRTHRLGLTGEGALRIGFAMMDLPVLQEPPNPIPEDPTGRLSGHLAETQTGRPRVHWGLLPTLRPAMFSAPPPHSPFLTKPSPPRPLLPRPCCTDPARSCGEGSGAGLPPWPFLTVSPQRGERPAESQLVGMEATPLATCRYAVCASAGSSSNNTVTNT